MLLCSTTIYLLPMLLISLKPYLSAVLYILISSLGFLLHYVIPQARKSLPWLIFTKPLLKSREHDVFEVRKRCFDSIHRRPINCQMRLFSASGLRLCPTCAGVGKHFRLMPVEAQLKISIPHFFSISLVVRHQEVLL